MQTKTIDQLPEIDVLTDGTEFPVRKDGTTYKTDFETIQGNISGRFNYLPFLVPNPANRNSLILKGGISLKGSTGETFYFTSDQIITGSTFVEGRDFYAVITNDGELLILNQADKIAAGSDIKVIGGCHTLCANAGTGMTYEMGEQVLPHPLNGFLAGDILPQSVWCLNHRPFSEPEGMFYVPDLDFWCDIYLGSGSGFNTKSAYQGAITRSRQYVDFVEDMICVKKELLNDSEFAAAAIGSNEMTAVAGANQAGATTGGAGGRIDTASRRMLSIYGGEEMCGSLWQYLRSTAAAGYEGSMYGQISRPGVAPITYGRFWSANGRTVSDSTGVNLMETSYAPQSGNKGSFYYMCAVLRAGGAWSNSPGCGSRARAASSARSNASSDGGGRGRSRAIHLAY